MPSQKQRHIDQMTIRNLVFWTAVAIGAAAAVILITGRDPVSETSVEQGARSSTPTQAASPAQDEGSRAGSGEVATASGSSQQMSPDRSAERPVAAEPLPIPPNTGRALPDIYLREQPINRVRLKELARSFRANSVSGDALRTLGSQEAEDILLRWLTPLAQDWAVSLLKQRALSQDDFQSLRQLATTEFSSLGDAFRTLERLAQLPQLPTTEEYSEVRDLLEQGTADWEGGRYAFALVSIKNELPIYIKSRLQLAENFYRSRLREFFSNSAVSVDEKLAYYHQLETAGEKSLSWYARGYLETLREQDGLTVASRKEIDRILGDAAP